MAAVAGRVRPLLYRSTDMKHTGPKTGTGPSASGFSLVEVIVVVGIIMVLAAVMAPAIANWARNYQIRGATQNGGRRDPDGPQPGHLQERQPRRFDRRRGRQPPTGRTPRTTRPQPKTTARVPHRSSRPRTTCSRCAARCREGIEFALNAADCPVVAGFAPADYGFRFNRLGAWCDPGGGGACPDVIIAGAHRRTRWPPRPPPARRCAWSSGGTGLSRFVTVTPGGRVLAQQ